MKRLKGRKYFWTDHDQSFVGNYFDCVTYNLDSIEILEKGAVFLEEISNWNSTYDYAVDYRAVRSSLIQELLK